MIMQRIRTIFTGVAGTPWYNNLYFNEESGSPNDRISAVFEFWNTLAAVINDSVTFQVQGDVAFVDDATGDIVEVQTDLAQSGAGDETGDPLPHANQGLLRLRTGVYVGGRQIVGRVFVPGMTESVATNGLLTSTAITQLETAAAVLKDDEGSWRVYSPTKHTSADITSWSAWNQFAVLRSRRD